MIDPAKKYRNCYGDEVLAIFPRGRGGFTIVARHQRRFADNDDYCYRVSGGGSHADNPGYNLIEVKPEVTVRGYVAIKGRDVSVTSDLTPAAGWIELGAIDITHDGEKLIKVEIVK